MTAIFEDCKKEENDASVSNRKIKLSCVWTSLNWRNGYISGFLFWLAALLVSSQLLAGGQPSANKQQAEGNLRAGAAAVKITPPVGSIMGNSYGIAVSEGIHDDLFAKILVFELGGVKTAFVAMDLISIPHEIVMKTREQISKTSDIPASNVIMTATHAHAGPQLNPAFWDAVGGEPKQKSQAYAESLPGLVADGVKQAESKLQPARLSIGSVEEYAVNFNRRFMMKDGSFRTNPGRMNPNVARPMGPVDPDVSVVYIESMESDPIALLVNFALHPAVVGGKHFSADFPGVVSSLLAKVKDDDMVTVYTNGTSGNINHVDVKQESRLDHYEESFRIGTIIAADVLKALSRLEEIKVDYLAVLNREVKLPIPAVEKDEIDWAKKAMARFGKDSSLPFSDVVKAWRILDLVQEGGVEGRHQSTTTVPLTGNALQSEVQAMALGSDLALVGFPGDAFVELGLAIKLNSPFRHTIVNEQSGNGTLSYIPNYKAFPEGGYEVISARYLPGGAELLVEAVDRLLVDIYPYK